MTKYVLKFRYRIQIDTAERGSMDILSTLTLKSYRLAYINILMEVFILRCKTASDIKIRYKE